MVQQQPQSRTAGRTGTASSQDQAQHHHHRHPPPGSPIITSSIRRGLYDGKRRVSVQYKPWAGSKGMLPLQKYCNPMDNQSFQSWLVKPFPPPPLMNALFPPSPSSSSSSLQSYITCKSTPLKSNKEQAEYRASLELNPNLHLKLIYIDAHMIVITKPSGILSVPGPKRKPNTASLVHAHFIANQNQDNQDNSCEHGNTDYGKSQNENENENDVDGMIVHRLDMDTSGIIIYARNKLVLSILHNGFRSKSATVSASAPNKKNSKKNTTTRIDDKKSQLFLHSQVHSNSNSNAQSQSHEPQLVTKTYEALVCGHMPTMEGEIDLPLMRDADCPPFMKVWNGENNSNSSIQKNKNGKGKNSIENSIIVHQKESLPLRNSSDALHKHRGYIKMMSKAPKESLTHYRVLSKEYLVLSDTNYDDDNDYSYGGEDDNRQEKRQERYLPVTRVELIPITGRTHQLRVHCAAIGHPIVGDNIYGIYGDGSPHGGLHYEDVMMKSFPQMASISLQADIFNFVQQQRKRHDFYQRSQSGKSEKGPMSIINHDKVCNEEREDVMSHQPHEYRGDLCLHARKLCIQHPITLAPMSFEADPPF